MHACLRFTCSAGQIHRLFFHAVKKLLVDSQALALFDPTLHTKVSTDASDYALGAILGPEKVKWIVASASRTLALLRDDATVLKSHIKVPYQWGHRFTLRIDHQTLTSMLATKGIGTPVYVCQGLLVLIMICCPGAENASAGYTYLCLLAHWLMASSLLPPLHA